MNHVEYHKQIEKYMPAIRVLFFAFLFCPIFAKISSFRILLAFHWLLQPTYISQVISN